MPPSVNSTPTKCAFCQGYGDITSGCICVLSGEKARKDDGVSNLCKARKHDTSGNSGAVNPRETFSPLTKDDVKDLKPDMAELVELLVQLSSEVLPDEMNNKIIEKAKELNSEKFEVIKKEKVLCAVQGLKQRKVCVVDKIHNPNECIYVVKLDDVDYFFPIAKKGEE